MATHVPWRSTLKHGEFNCGSMAFRVISRARTLFLRPWHLEITRIQTLQSSVSSLGISVPSILKKSHSMITLHCDAHCLHFPSRYFTRELQPLGALGKANLPLYLSTWLLKSSPHCMYSVRLLCSWSALHLKSGCWYLDCGKTFYPEDEEDVKKSCAQAESKGVESGSINGNDHDGHKNEEQEEDLSVLAEKERNKIEAKNKKDKERQDKKKEKEALKTKGSKEKPKKGEVKAKEAKEKATSEVPAKPLREPSSPIVVLLQTETLPPNPRKRDADFAGLSVSRPSLKDSSVDTVQIDEFFCNGSLQTLDAYFTEHEAFSKEWMDL
jgi:hypothetical protein